MPSMALLIVSEIFHSIQGEGTRAGLPCTFVRLAGCNLRCARCDTRYAMEDGQAMTVEDVLSRVEAFGCPRVEVTGGEPLLQEAAPELLWRLCDAGGEVLLETNGSLDIDLADRRVVRIVDFKAPSSGQEGSNLWSNVERLTPRDEVKFVVADRADFDWAVAAAQQHGLLVGCPVIFSPVLDRLKPATLAEWILAERMDVRLGLQLHKVIWPGEDRGV